MNTTKRLTGKFLTTAQNKMIESLTDPTDDKRFDFYTKEDSKHQQERKLVKATIINDIEDLFLLEDEFYKTKFNYVGIDIEATGFNYWEEEILGVGFSVMTEDLYYIVDYIVKNGVDDVDQFFHHYYVNLNNYPGEKIELIQGLSEVLAEFNHNTYWYLHNSKFDMHWLKSRLGFHLKHIEDSMVMAYVLCEKSKAIDKLAPKYLSRFPHTLKEYLGKDKITREDMLSIPIEWIADYCCEDAFEGVLLSLVLERKLYEERSSSDQMGYWCLYDVYHRIDRYCIHSLVWAEEEGCLIDWDKLSTVGETIEAELWGIEFEIADLLEVSKEEASKIANSPQELSRVLYDELKLPTEKIKPTKYGFSTAVEALNELKNYHPLPKTVLDYRKLAKVNGTYIKGFYQRNRNHKLHTTFNNCLTDTGRLSSSDPNLQNIPNPVLSSTGKLIRQCFIAEEGNVLVKADYSQFELRILAHFSQDEYLLDAYNTGKDVHSVVTCLLFDLDYDTFDATNNKQHKTYRRLIKTINFALIYGMTAHRLLNESRKTGLNYSFAECEEVMAKYWAKLPGVAEWMAYVKLKAIRDGYTETVFGRRRYFEFQHPYLKKLRGKDLELSSRNLKALEQKGAINDPKDAEALRACGNAPIQGSNGDAIRIATGKLHEMYYGTAVKLILQVHDEIVLECPWEIQEDVASTLTEVMTSVIKLSVPVVVEPSIALTWGDT